MSIPIWPPSLSDRKVPARWPLLALAAVLAVAFNLRIVLASVPPVIPAIRHDLLLNRGAAGLLTTIPVACMGIFAPFASRLGIRLGTERAIATALLVIAVAAAIRGLGGTLTLYGATVVAGMGIAVTGPLLNGFIKARFPRQAGVVIGMYTASLSLGAACAAGGTGVAVDHAGISWHVALALWAIPAAVAVGLWLAAVSSPTPEAARRDDGPRAPLPWCDIRAWTVTIVFALQAFTYYGVLAWLAPLYVEHGWSQGNAGVLLSLFSVAQIAGALLIPLGASRSRDRRPWIAACAATGMVGLVALALIPTTAPPLWSIALGFGIGGLFPLALTLPLDYADTPTEVSALTGMELGVGYSIAAVSPFLIGVIRDAAGSYLPPFLVVAAMAGGLLAMTPLLRPRVPGHP